MSSETFESWLTSEVAKAETLKQKVQQDGGACTLDWCRGNLSALNAVNSAYNALNTTSDETRVDL